MVASRNEAGQEPPGGPGERADRLDRIEMSDREKLGFFDSVRSKDLKQSVMVGAAAARSRAP